MSERQQPGPCPDARPFAGSGRWALILGGSSGFGLASALRLARAGLNVWVGHKDARGAMGPVEEAFARIRAEGVELETHNGDLLDEDERGELLERVEERVPPGSLHLLLHSLAAGSTRSLVRPPADRPDPRARALEGLRAALEAQGVALGAEQLERAVDQAFHVGRCDALYTLARSRIPAREELLSEGDLARTLFAMGYDAMLWARELLSSGRFAPGGRVIGLTSQGSSIAWHGYAAVSAAKSVLESASRSMALELGPHGLRSMVVQAGITDTPAGNAIPNFDLLKAEARLRSPSGRLTTPEDVAEAICALCQPGFDWANGALFRIDGGEAVVGS
ncbi:MAG: SDR family NAD(P)-dependent oxidoreductase [Planctomycetota bacterium]